MPAPVIPTGTPLRGTEMMLEVLKQLEYLGNQFSGSLNLSRGYIPIDLFSAREIDTNAIVAPVVEAATNPILERINGATDRGVRILWAAADETELQLPTIAMPPDFNDAQDAEIHLLTEKDADADTVTLDVQVFDGVGDTEMGTLIAAVPLALSEQIVTIVAANLTGHPLGFLNVSLTPGTHAGDDLRLYAAWLEYTRV